MALGKHSRVDGRRSSSYCSTVTIVVFVAFCLVGVWMLMSSYVVPVQNSDLTSQETKNVVQEKVTKHDSNQFEDSSGDLPEDATKGDDNTETSQYESNSDAVEKQNLSENTVEENQEEKSEEKTEAKEEPETESAIDESRKREDGEANSGDGEANSEAGETKTEGGETNATEQTEYEKSLGENKPDSDESEKKSEMEGETSQEDKVGGQTEEEKIEQNQDKESEESAGENQIKSQLKDQVSNEVFPDGAQSEILNETTTQSGAWSTQAVESKNEKESQQSSLSKNQNNHGWKLCKVTAGPDYIPCLDNLQTIRRLPSTKHYEHRERHCPEEAPTCLVPLPEGYKRPVKWPKSRDKVHYTSSGSNRKPLLHVHYSG